MRKYQTKAKFIFTYNKENIIDRDLSLFISSLPSSTSNTEQDWQLTKVQTSVTLTQDLALYTLLIKIF